MHISREEAELLLEEAKQLVRKGQYDNALGILEQITLVFEQVGDWERYVKCLSEWGDVLIRVDKLQESLQILEKALIVYHAQTLDNKLLLSTIYLSQSSVFRWQYDLENALKLAELALALMLGEEMHPESDIFLGRVYACIASIHNQVWRLDLALDYFDRAEKIFLQYHTQHAKLSLAANYTNKSTSCSNAQNFKEAMKYAELSNNILKDIVEEDSILFCYNYHQIATCYCHWSCYNVALDYSKLALSIAYKHFDTLHDKCMEFCLSVAGLHLRLGDVDAALPYLDNIKKSNRDKHKFMHSYTLGTYYSEKENYATAIGYLKQAFDIAVTLFGTKHPFYNACLHNIGNAYFGLKNHDAAIDYLKQAIENSKNIWTDDNTDVGSYWHSLGVSYMDKGDYERGFTCLEKAIAIHETHTGLKNYYTARTYTDLGIYYYKTGNTEKAAETLQFAYQCLFMCDDKVIDFHFDGCLSKESAILIVSELAKVYATKTTGFENEYVSNIGQSLTYYQVFDYLVDEMRNSYGEEGSKLYLAKKATTIYDQAMEVALVWAAQQGANITYL